jgi:4-diphosphocytidyl-2-C-methyl-D-erythritol kinase
MDGVLQGEDNTATRALRVFEETYFTPRVRVDITKGIPMGAGMGGSSADAAAVLYALSVIYGVDTYPLAIRVGSDVPYMMRGGVCRVRGLGERVDGYGYREYPITLLYSGSVDTGAAYRLYDTLGATASVDTDGVIDAYSRGDLEELMRISRNDLYTPATVLNPDISAMREELMSLGARYVSMTGSGSAVYGIFDTVPAYDGKYSIIHTSTVRDGIEILEEKF